jgi:amidase
MTTPDINMPTSRPADKTINAIPAIPPLTQLTLSTVQNAYHNHLFTAVDLTSTYLTRIRETNPTFHAVAEVNPDATSLAQHLDAERLARGPRGPLHGIPILLKDNMPTVHDATSTTCGSIALVGAQPCREAEVVKAVRQAGMVVLGKGNMAEWAGFRSTSGCSGWSGRGGQTTGVFYPGMKASGSSGGCAVAVALGMCFAALGTEVSYLTLCRVEKKRELTRYI